MSASRAPRPPADRPLPAADSPQLTAVRAALERFAAARFGMDLGCYPSSLVQGLVRELPSAQALQESRWQERVLAALSIGETHFLRHRSQFTVLQRWAAAHLPPGSRKLRVWSAACSTGEEVWSIAATLREVRALGGRFEVEGSDLNPQSVATAQAGTYRTWSMRSVSETDAAGWLTRTRRRDGAESIQVDEGLRPHVRFAQRNLVTDAYPQHLDVVFCRNVLIYFGPDAIQEVYRRLQASLRPGGVLFISATDPEPAPSVGFVSRFEDGVRLLYRPGPGISDAPSPGAPRPPVRAAPPAPPPQESAEPASSRARRAISRWQASTRGAGRSVPYSPAPAPSPVVPEAAPRPAPPPERTVAQEAAPDAVETTVRTLLERAQAGRLMNTMAQLDDCIEEAPDEVRYRLLAAELALQMGMIDLGIQHARRALFLQPEALWPNHLMGQLLLARGPSPYAQRLLSLARSRLSELPPSAVVPLTGGRTVLALSSKVNADASPARDHLARR